MAPRKDREYAVMKQDPFEPRIWHDHGIEVAVKPDDARAIARSRVSAEERKGTWVAIPTANFQPSSYTEKVTVDWEEKPVKLPEPNERVHLDADGNVPAPGQTDLDRQGVKTDGSGQVAAPPPEPQAAIPAEEGPAAVEPPEQAAVVPAEAPKAKGSPAGAPITDIPEEATPHVIVPDPAAAEAPVADAPPAATPPQPAAEQGPPAEAPAVAVPPEPAHEERPAETGTEVAERLRLSEAARKQREQEERVAKNKAEREAALAKAAAANGGTLPPGPDGLGGAPAAPAATGGDGFGIPAGF